MARRKKFNAAQFTGAGFPDARTLVRVARDVSDQLVASGNDVALIGGLAMQVYGSSRLTMDVDLAINGEGAPLRGDPLVFGGVSFKSRGVDVDVVNRDDAFRTLYLAAVTTAVPTRYGFNIVLPKFLAAMKMVAARPTDHEDIIWLLQRKLESGPLLNRHDTEEVMSDFVGGAFAVQSFKRTAEEADWRLKMENSR